jgi:signal transduction histidine kinase
VEDSATIIADCINLALSQVDFVDKDALLACLEKTYEIKIQDIGDNFEAFHELIKKLYGVRHHKIERVLIQALRDQTIRGKYGHSIEVDAFVRMTRVFSRDIEQNVEIRQELLDSRQYAKNLEDKVKAADEKLRSSERLAAIGATAGMVGHDIRNPLQAIVSEIFLLRLDVESLPEGKTKQSMIESLEGIETNSLYINKIVQDLQDFAKEIVPVIKYTETELIVRDVLVKKAVPSNIEALFEISADTKTVNTDEVLIKRILTNLVNNAVQAMPSGGKLLLKISRSANGIMVTVQDTGVGIPEEVKPKLFTPLFTTKSKGQGFGLASVKRMVEALGGKIGFESEIGKGTKFTVELPVIAQSQ